MREDIGGEKMLEEKRRGDLEVTAKHWAEQLGRVAKNYFGKYAKGEITLEEAEKEVRKDVDGMFEQFRKMRDRA